MLSVTIADGPSEREECAQICRMSLFVLIESGHAPLRRDHSRSCLSAVASICEPVGLLPGSNRSVPYLTRTPRRER